MTQEIISSQWRQLINHLKPHKMKIELMFNDQQITVGFKLIREDGDDIVTVERVRDMLFWGLEETALNYNGRKTNDKEETVELRFATKAHRDEERRKMEEDVKKLVSERQKSSIDLRKNISLNDMPQEIREQFD